MARRRTNDDPVIAIVESVALLLLLLAVVLVLAHQRIPGAAFWIPALLASGAMGFVLFQFVRPKRSLPSPAFQNGEKVDWLGFNIEVEEEKTPEKPQSPARLLESLRTIDWFQFEKVVAAVYRKKGYAVERRGGAKADGGIDLIIAKDGRRRAVQCKQWKTWNVGVSAVREFLGALKDAEIESGIFVTLQGYTGDAKRLADKHGIEILNETGLVKLLEEVDAAFDPDILEQLYDTTKYCPKCEREMVRRLARRGRSAGKYFWACPAFPRCNGKISIP